MKPIIAIVGRANVGKSTLFNRLLKKQVAIVEDLPGTTRDRVFADTFLYDHEVTLIDTGGLGLLQESTLGKKVKKQVDVAIAESDIILLMVDVKDGIITSDREIAEQLRKNQKPVVLVVNKVDNSKLETEVANFYQLGLNKVVAISAHHNRGIGNLMDMVIELLPPPLPITPELNIPKLAIVGRPNVGKSMLLNALVGKERSIVDSTPGTTRDAIDTIHNFPGQDILLIDTAGIRKRGKSGTGVDYYSLVRSLRAIERCDVALLVVDASEFITAQDTHIAGYVKDSFKGMILVVNKCDLVTRDTEEQLGEQMAQRFKFMAYSPVLYVSAKNSDRIGRIIPEALKIWQQRQLQLPNSVIDKLIKAAVESNAPPPKGLRRLEVIRAYQESVNPPTFVLLVNDPDLMHFSYQRFLENKLRHTFGFFGTPLRFSFRKAPRRRRSRQSGAGSVAHT
jgi:GTP-binding protein